jgi:WD40 repeat protein
MEMFRQVGVYAPLLLYIWLGIAYLLGYLRTRQSNLSTHLVVLLTLSLSFFIRASAEDNDQLEMVLYLFYAVYPLLDIWTILRGNKALAGYRHPTDLLLLKKPVGSMTNAGPIFPGVQPDYGTRISLLLTLPLLAIALGFAGYSLQTCRWLDVALGESGCLGYFKYTDQVDTLDFSRDGTMIAAGGYEHWAQLSRMPDGHPLHRLNGHTDTVYTVAFSPDSAILATGATDSTLRFWKTRDGMPLRTISLADLKDGFDTTVAVIAFSPDGKFIATGSGGSGMPSSVRLWNMSSNTPLKTWPADGEYLAFSPDGKLLAMQGRQGGIVLRTVPDGNMVRTLQTTGTYGLTGLAYSPDGNYVAASQYSYDGLTDVWRVADGTKVHTFHGHTSRASTVAFSSDSRYLATGGLDGLTALWDLATEKQVGLWKSTRYGIDKVAFSSDGKLLASASSWTVYLWRVPR